MKSNVIHYDFRRKERNKRLTEITRQWIVAASALGKTLSAKEYEKIMNPLKAERQQLLDEIKDIIDRQENSDEIWFVDEEESNDEYDDE